MQQAPTQNSFFYKFFRQAALSVLGRVATIWAFAAKPQGGKYELSHLVQPEAQNVSGPIQDDEALFLFSVVRGMRMRAILEVGGLRGFSALNFSRALPPGEGGFVATVDVDKVPGVADNHETVIMPAGSVQARDLLPLFEKYSLPPRFDLVFFDAHIYDEQTKLLHNLRQAGMADDSTVIAFHDTCLSPMATTIFDKYEKHDNGEEGFCHGAEHRQMVRDLTAAGYSSFSLAPRSEHLDGKVKFRHGLTVMRPQKWLS